MSLAGLRKQFNKANQLVNEKFGAAEGTKLDDEYVKCEAQIDIMSKLIEEIINKTQEFLQPNPATRARLATISTINKMQGKVKSAPSPQPEGQLGECMEKFGTELSDDSIFGECLVQSGRSFKHMEEIKNNMESQVKQMYIEPLRGFQSVELKEIQHHRKKLEGRRLDFDCKKRKQDSNPQGAKVIDDEVKVAEDKFKESKHLAETAMFNFLASDLDHISALAEFVDAQASYYRQASEIMDNLHKVLLEKKDEAEARGHHIRVPKPVMNSSLDRRVKNDTNNTIPNAASGPCCRALFQFEAENDTELNFDEGDIIQLIRQVDENWYEGRINNKEGFFPVNYVEVVEPLPKSLSTFPTE